MFSDLLLARWALGILFLSLISSFLILSSECYFNIPTMCGLLRFFVCPGAWCVIVRVPHVLKEKACSLLLEHDVRYMSLASIHSVTLWFWEEASPRRVNAAPSDNFPAPDRAKGVPSVVWLRGTCSKMPPLSPPCSVARPICLGQALICRHRRWPWAGNGEASLR